MNELNHFYVIAVMTNPERYKTRPRLFREFMKRMDGYGAKLYVVEGAFGARDFEVTEAGNPRHIQVRTESEIWQKENLINIGITHLPSDWKYVAWIDGDIDFLRPDWMAETVHELQHHSVVQMFEDVIDMGPTHEIMSTHKGFAACYAKGIARTRPTAAASAGKSKKSSSIAAAQSSGDCEYGYATTGVESGHSGSYWHPGYAWAATRDAINTLGGLFEHGIAGGGDNHFATSMIGQALTSCPRLIHPEYKDLLLAYEERALRLHKNIGYVKGSICHYWHGKKRDRHYRDRWSILIDNKFRPSSFIHKDWQGVLSLYPGHDGLRSDLRAYFQSRNEDSIDVD